MNKWITGLLAATMTLGAGAALAADSLTFAVLAGKAGSLVKSADGTGMAAEFYAPRGVAVDSAGNLYVADASNNTIRKITPAGVVTTLAGGDSGSKGSVDGTGSAARFWEPRGVAVDSAGNVYVADYMSHAIRKVTPAGVVTTLAGTLGTEGNSDGTGTAALFRGPMGVAVDSTGNVYVMDTGNRAVRKITAAGVVTTVASNSSGAHFGESRGIAVDGSGTVYVSDYSSNVVHKVTASGGATLLAGNSSGSGSSDGSGTAASFYSPSGIAADSAGNLYLADTANNTIRKITAAGVVTTIAGTAGKSSSVDGTGTAALFEDPYATAADSAGNVYVADATDHSIRKVTPAGVVTTLAGKAGSSGSADGTATAARFKGPLGIAVDSTGNVYVADTGNHSIRKITSVGVVTTFAGSAGNSGNSDGTGTAARFAEPNGVAVDGAGNLYVADTANNTIRKITAAGVVTTMAGTAGSVGFTNGTGTAARFTVPFDVAVDSAGNVYVSDHGNHVVRKITAAGVVTTLAGSGTAGSTNGTGTAASFRYPSGISVDSAGNVYLADTDNHLIRKISPAGEVATAAGKGQPGSSDGTGTAAAFFNPKDVTVDGSGNVYIADRGNHTIRKGSSGTASTAISNSAADCLFSWGERSYPALLAPAATSFSAAPYYYRYYAASKAYVGVSSADGHLYFYADGKLIDLAAASTWLTQAGCQ